ncbi:MAG: maleylacetate reductase [Gammaproteobacteria bacterium]|nr:maleylacetate reductase [Gammaproteobacteria bacterium]
MNEFTYNALPGHIIFGAGKLQSLADEIDRLGCSRVLVLTTPEQIDQGEMIKELIGDRWVASFNQATMHVPTDVVDQALDVAEAANVDCVVGIGGGSTTGLGKALALRSDLLIVAIPTTYAGSEMTPIWGLTENGIKKTGRDPRVLPTSVIYDPDLTLSLPPFISGPSGVNAIAHCVEALYAPDANPITSLIAEEGINALSSSLATVVNEPGNKDARAKALYGAYLAGSALAAVGMSLHHKLCHTLGGSFDLPHADVHTIILPYATRYNAEATPEAMQRICRAMGTEDAAQGLYDLNRSIGAKSGLKDLGFEENDIEKAADIATQNPYANPAPVTKEGVIKLLTDAYHGVRP